MFEVTLHELLFQPKVAFTLLVPVVLLKFQNSQKLKLVIVLSVLLLIVCAALKYSAVKASVVFAGALIERG